MFACSEKPCATATRLPTSAYSSRRDGTSNSAGHFLSALTANFRQELRATHPGINVSLVSPGAVATDFGLNALHGGVDSRALPDAQSAAEVALVIAELIEHPRADVYTRPAFKQLVAGYYAAEDMAAAEHLPPFGPR